MYLGEAISSFRRVSYASLYVSDFVCQTRWLPTFSLESNFSFEFPEPPGILRNFMTIVFLPPTLRTFAYAHAQPPSRKLDCDIGGNIFHETILSVIDTRQLRSYEVRGIFLFRWLLTFPTISRANRATCISVRIPSRKKIRCCNAITSINQPRSGQRIGYVTEMRFASC